MDHFPRMPRDHVLIPDDEEALRKLIVECGQSGRTLRVVGSSHSVAQSIAESNDVIVSLEKLRRVLQFDPLQGRIRVQAGMTLGPCPLWPERQDSETLGGYLQKEALAHDSGWALPSLGGITHQTVGGFVSTGSSGGSLKYSLSDSIVSFDLIDGRGDSRTIRRGDPQFDAVAVSLGLCGVITSVEFQCVPWFDIIGRETTTLTSECAIDLFGSGAGSLRDFLTQTPYARLLWWPQAGVDKITVWQARRMERADYLAQESAPLRLKRRPYEAIGMLGQLVADAFYSFLGLGYGSDFLDRCIKAVTPAIAAPVINAFVPVNAGTPTLFWDYWRFGLPMDDHSSDTLMATGFTELWIPIERAQEVMIALRDHYRDNGLSATGTYACEIYAAKRSQSWLSPSYGSDMVRFDFFWFERNREDPVTTFYPQFWSLLERFDYRPHWAKSLPPASSTTGTAYLRKQYPSFDAFMEVRAELDPDQVFVTDYWREHLGIASEPARLHSVVVPRGAEDRDVLASDGSQSA